MNEYLPPLTPPVTAKKKHVGLWIAIGLVALVLLGAIGSAVDKIDLNPGSAGYVSTTDSYGLTAAEEAALDATWLGLDASTQAALCSYFSDGIDPGFEAEIIRQSASKAGISYEELARGTAYVTDAYC
jgi:hypothetical protein